MNTKVVVGLGNPGKKYDGTRHNIGFQAVTEFAAQNHQEFSGHAQIPAIIAQWKDKNIKWIVLKPITFMNLSGQAVVAALNYWKVETSSLLVVVDDVELAAGSLRLRTQGNAGGHNGLKSIIEHLGTKDFARLRMGIGRPSHLPKELLADWVLQSFEKSELPWVEECINKTIRAIESWALEGPEVAMNRFNTVRHPLKKEPPPTPPEKEIL
jgi:peptidyl-tRNA hydrolase, PTH1 family